MDGPSDSVALVPGPSPEAGGVHGTVGVIAAGGALVVLAAVGTAVAARRRSASRTPDARVVAG